MYVNDFNGYGSYDGLWDSIKSIIPKHTVVGKLIGGNVGGAITDAAKLAQKRTYVPPKPIKPAGAGAFSPGGFIEKNQTMLLVAAAGLGAFLLFKRSR